MCDICVMNTVKARMLSRLDLFKSAIGGAALALGAAAVGATAAGTPAMAAGYGAVADMTYDLNAESPTYFGTPGFSAERAFKFSESGFNLFNPSINEHTGTHIDAPLHFSADGNAVNEIPIGDLIAPLCVIDIAARAAGDADTQMTPDDLKAYIAAHGEVPDGACVAMRSGWGEHVATDKYRGFDGKKQYYPPSMRKQRSC